MERHGLQRILATNGNEGGTESDVV
jgi:hypothetical protein